ncbi:MAG: hypothetical protein NVS3B26_30210 [Mycobacteriales bacterium]
MRGASVGLTGTVVTRIRGGELPGEVRVLYAGLPHTYIAYADIALPVGASVLVINDRGARRIDVEPWDLPATDAVDACGEPRRP